MFRFTHSWALALAAGLVASPALAQEVKDPTAYFDQLNKAAQAAASVQSINNLKQIAIAFHIHHDVANQLPGNIVDKDGKPLLSWRVAILPYIEQDNVYKQFKLDEPWDSANNKKLLDQMPKIYRNPRFQKADDKASVTYYQGFTGEGGVIGAKKLNLTDITNVNGTSNTVLAVEAGAPVPWTKPEDLAHDLKKPLPKLAGAGGNFIAAFCDGHVQRIPAKTDEKVLRCMIQWNNKEAFKLP